MLLFSLFALIITAVTHVIEEMAAIENFSLILVPRALEANKTNIFQLFPFFIT